MNKYRLIQTSTYNNQEYKEEYQIQKNYGNIIPDWITIITLEDKQEAINKIEELKHDKTIKYQYKTIKEIKTR